MKKNDKDIPISATLCTLVLKCQCRHSGKNDLDFQIFFVSFYIKLTLNLLDWYF